MGKYNILCSILNQSSHHLVENERDAIDDAIVDVISIANDIIPDVEKFINYLDKIGNTVRNLSNASNYFFIID